MSDGNGTERTFIMVKPDGVRGNLTGEIINRIERKGLRITALKKLNVDEKTAMEHYAEHEGKTFFPALVEHIMSGPAVAMVVEGRNAISIVRALVGSTDPADAAPGTIRGDYGIRITQNVVHASDAQATAECEIGIYFTEGDICKS